MELFLRNERNQFSLDYQDILDEAQKMKNARISDCFHMILAYSDILLLKDNSTLQAISAAKSCVIQAKTLLSSATTPDGFYFSCFSLISYCFSLFHQILKNYMIKWKMQSDKYFG